MRIVQLNPIEVESFIRHCDNVKKNSILIGKCKYNSYYLSNLTFETILINFNEILINAVLKMHCKKVCGFNDYINICINNDDINGDVNDEGDYEWDVTSLVKNCNNQILNLCVYPKMWISQCGIKEFEAVDSDTMPVLELIIDEKLLNPDQNIVNIVNEYVSNQYLSHSEWIECISLNKYYYFIENLGDSDVIVSIEISPDKKLIYKDSEFLIIKSKEVAYLQPMRDSRYIRLSYENMPPNGSNLIKVWYQGKK
nr:DUF6385 domain-containing protein [Sedimentibacter sp.]